MLSLKGCIVTADALNCQRTIAAKVTEQGGDYVLALKGNQGSLHDDVRTFLDDPMRPAEACHTTVDGQHGRIETRISEVSADIAWLQDQHVWPACRYRQDDPNPRNRRQKHNGNVLLPAEHAALCRTLRSGHPRTLGRRERSTLGARCDHERGPGRHCKDHGPENIALLRRLALNLAKLEGSKGSMKGRLKRAGWDDAFLTSLLAQFSKGHMR
jgi:predicted transposase YbfD/YdcC